MERLTDQQRDVIIGTLLGDGYLEKRGNSIRLVFSQTEKRRAYVEWKHDILKDISHSIKHYTYADERLKNKRYGFYVLKTTPHPEFAKFYKMFYDETGKKIVPPNISKLLTPLAVAVWYMDDGSLSLGAPIFNTQKFPLKEQFILIKALKKFHIVASINKDRDSYRMRILKRCAKRFADFVRPYIHPEFLYKLPKE